MQPLPPERTSDLGGDVPGKVRMPVKVLVVDDDETFRWLSGTLLRSDRNVGPIVEAEDGLAAVDLMRREQPPPHVVVIDVMMPRLDGFQATRLIKREWPATKVVVVTSVPDERYRAAAYASGADAFLDKRDLGTALLPIVRGLTGSGLQDPSEGPDLGEARMPW